MSGFASWLKRAAGGHAKSDSRSEPKAASSSANQPQQPQQAAKQPASVPAPYPPVETLPPAMLRHGEFVGSLDCGTTYVVDLTRFIAPSDIRAGPRGS